MAVPVSRNITIQQNLADENIRIEKHEFYRGEVFAMAGAGKNHIIIQKNFFGELYLHLKGKSCQPFGSETRVHIPSNTLCTYPNISVICGEIQFSKEDKNSVLNPTVLIKILYPSTRDYDMGGKFRLYQDIPMLKEYVIADSEKIEIIRYFINQHNNWEQEIYETIGDSVNIRCIDVTIPLSEIYSGVEW